MNYRTFHLLMAALCLFPTYAAGQTVKRSVVQITKDNTGTDLGAGIIVGYSGKKVYVLTAYHVVEDAQNLHVKFYETANLGPGHEVGPPVKIDMENDLAVLVVDFFPRFPDLKYNKLVKPKSDKPRTGRSVSCIGHPFGNSWFYQKFNSVSDPEATPLTFEFTGIGIEPGYSGGPIFYGTGNRLVGMITRVSSSGGQAVSTEVLLAYLEKWGIPTNLLRSSIKTGTYLLEALSIGQAAVGYFEFDQEVKNLNKEVNEFRNPEAFTLQFPPHSREDFADQAATAQNKRNLFYLGSALTLLGGAAIEIDWKKLFGKEPTHTPASEGKLSRDDLFGTALLIRGNGQIGIKFTF